jgi:hypothetical protein
MNPKIKSPQKRKRRKAFKKSTGFDFWNIGKYCAILFLILGTFFSAWSFIDGRYARGETVKQLEMRFDLRNETDVLNSMRSRLYELEKRYPVLEKAPPETVKEIKQLREDIKDQVEKVKIIQKEMLRQKK